MKRALFGVSLYFLLFVAATFCQAASGIQDGLWEMDMEVLMEGLPIAMPAVTSTVQQCISRNDLVPKDPESTKNCRFKNMKVSGNKVSWEFECSQDEGKASGKGEMTYSGSSCSGNSKTIFTSRDGEKMTSKTKIKGRRIGVCPPGGVPAPTGQQVDPEMKKILDKSSEMQEQQQLAQKRAMALAKVKVPREKSDACVYLVSNAINPDCDGRWGKISLQEGEWTITEEQASKSQATMLPAFSQDSKTCLSPADPVPREFLSRGCSEAVLKRSGNTLTWKILCNSGSTRVEGEGGIEFKGTSFEGAMILRNNSAPGAPMTTYSRLTGRRSAEGVCGRDYSAKQGRGYSPGGEKEPKLDNPVRKLRSFFGF